MQMRVMRPGGQVHQREAMVPVCSYCVNRDKDRVHNIWNDQIPNAFIAINPEGKIKGSAIALFGISESGYRIFGND